MCPVNVQATLIKNKQKELDGIHAQEAAAVAKDADKQCVVYGVGSSQCWGVTAVCACVWARRKLVAYRERIAKQKVAQQKAAATAFGAAHAKASITSVLDRLQVRHQCRAAVHWCIDHCRWIDCGGNAGDCLNDSVWHCLR